MTPPEKLRQIADEMERAKSDGKRDANRLIDWRNRLAALVAAMDASLDPIEQAGSLARQQRMRRSP